MLQFPPNTRCDNYHTTAKIPDNAPAKMASSNSEPDPERPQKRSDAFRIIEFLGSVKFGIVLLFLLVAVSLFGMLIPQYNVPGFERYVALLSPFKRQLYDALGFYDIYGSWYFRGLLMLLTMNIVISSVDHFPNTWKQVKNPAITPSERWIASLEVSTRMTVGTDAVEAEKRIANACRANCLKNVRLAEKDKKRYVFAERGAWNRFGAYAVHLALITIFVGGFITSQFSFSGKLLLSPGETTDRIDEIVYQGELPAIRFRRLPFRVRCTDLEQKLINSRGPLETLNTIDWLTSLEIVDGPAVTPAVISLNSPFSYGGYRFFHSTHLPIGKARSIRVSVSAPGFSETVAIPRGETATLQNGATLRFVDFRADLDLRRRAVNENSTDYKHPAAVLEVTPPGGPPKTMLAVRDSQIGERPPSVEGYTISLAGFEKVSERHELVVRYDPGAPVVYFGSALLIVSLLAVFLFSHRRVWFIIDPVSEFEVRIVSGGNANRNNPSFQLMFSNLCSAVETADLSAK